MSHEEAFGECVEAFAAGDWSTCVDRARALIQGATLHTLQLLLIGLQRLGEQETVEQIAPPVLEMAAGHPWDQTLLKLTLEQADPQQVLLQAGNAKQYCQVLFYVGAQMLTRGILNRQCRCSARVWTRSTIAWNVGWLVLNWTEKRPPVPCLKARSIRSTS